MVTTLVTIPGYQVNEQLYNGSKTLVYRGYRETDSLRVVIKLLKNPYPGFSELVQFRNQYTIAKNLNSPLIIQTYSLITYQNGYALVMEDFGGISLKEWGTGKSLRNLTEFLQIAIALCNTLDILYRERIIHKDIKPSNILINPETKQVKLIDFSIASLLPRETQTLINANILEGTLAYISPEQTGRMNRGIDYRTDLYSLGVTFYELLIGVLPFTSNDPMELVHCHIAKPAPLVGEINPQIPVVLSEIVKKLMAKNAEDRYQSALGLKFDLENCLHQLQVSDRIDNFEIAGRDVCDRFLIPDKLYGRETEVSTLLQAFERVSLGATEMMLVAGFSGIGKTAVVNEVHKPIVRQRGYFIKGKYDQFGHNIPFSAFVIAFRDLMGQLLTESDAQLQNWKIKILEAVGENGQVLIDVIPELEQIIAPQPPATEISGSAAQNRFNLLMQKFVQVFTSAENPLVIFLDDWQWADSASLKLLQLLMSQTGHLLVLGAYRDNEVSPVHPFILTVEEIVKTGATVNTISLQALSLVDLNQLVADTLNCELSQAQPLTELVYQKTQGNPFFATQFLKALHEDEHITFDFETQHWQCDIAQVRALAITDNVVEFMALQLQKLPRLTQNILKLAACIGAHFDLNTLAIVSEKSKEEAAADLWRALPEGLIIPTTEMYKFFTQSDTASIDRAVANPTYRFLHDRIQQAAYSLIPEEQRLSIHWKMGQLLLNHTPDIAQSLSGGFLRSELCNREQDNKLFDIVNHLNRGSRLITQPTEQEQIARLNLLAAKKARSATAYESAMTYATTGITLLTPDCWQSQYELALVLHELATESSFLARDLEQMEQWAKTVLQQAKTPLDRVKIYEIKIQTYISQHKPLDAIALGKQVLSQFGIQLSDQHTQEDIQQEFQHTANQFAGRPIEELLNLPPMTASEPLAAMRIAASTAPAVYFAAPSLYPFLILSQVNASIQHGNAPLSAFFYASYGLLLNGVLEDMEAGDRAGTLALGVVEKLNAKEVESKTRFLLGAYVLHGTNHIRKSLQFLRESYQIGLETGDIKFVGHAAFHICQFSYFSSQELLTLERDIRAYSHILTNLKQIMPFNYCQLFRQVTLNLLGNAKNPRLLVGDVYDEAQVLPRLLAAKDQMALHFFYLHKLILGYLFGDTAQSLSDIATHSREYLAAGAGYITVPIFYFYDSLVVLTRDFSADAELGDRLQRVAENQAKLHKWAHYAPMNYLHKWHLVEAEKHRVLGNKVEATDQYDRAIALAKEHGYLNEDALSNELAARFYLEWGKGRIAGEYMIEAYYCYTRWGAKAKVADLEIRYPQLLAPILQQTRSPFSTNETISNLGTVTSISSATSSSSSISVALDLAAILKASQSLSSEIELEKLLSSLLSIVIENAGADKCVLMLAQSGNLLVRGLAGLDQKNNGNTKVDFSSMLIDPQPVEESIDLPVGLVNTVKRSLQPAMIVDATVHPQLIHDPYIQQQQPKSILCSPILHQGKLLGILYLENNLATGAFCGDRVELLNLLCTQAAISLENAQLYERSQQYAQQLEESFAELSASNSRFEKLVDNVPGVVYQYRISADGAISLPYISADCYEIYEITAEQAIANVQFLLKVIHPDDAASHQQCVTDSIQTLTPFEWSGRIITPSGIVKWIHTEARIQKLADGSVVWDGLVLDISEQQAALRERKRIEAERQQKSLELEIALQDLQNAQLQIVQSEKMSALGNLVAGVAHEMNNPLGFIAASLEQAKPTVTDIFEHLRLYQESLPNKSDEILDHAEEIDLDYTLEDLPKIIDSMTMACDRLKNISTSLRTFSRVDKDYKVLFNIHEGIDSTILILKHRLKANEQRPAIEVITDYGNLPQLECFPGQLNQVFMNILANAIDALDESNTGRSFEEIKTNPNRITITTSIENEGVKIAIADNGKGMNEEVKQRIFDHLFTTKGVGKGTGLGLAIAKSIVEETHNGKLSFNSVLGEGTEFFIEIPL